MEELRAAGYSYDDLLRHAAKGLEWASVMENTCDQQEEIIEAQIKELNKFPDLIEQEIVRKRSELAKKAVDARYDKPGGRRENKSELLKMWATGQYSTKDRCADEWAEDLGMAVTTARRALQGAPDPDPWPTKKVKKTKK